VTFSVMPMPPRTLSWWRDERDDVDFSPVYQRKGHIWPETQQQYLIDSILNGFDIPKIYVADFTFLNSGLNQSRKKYAVIDGKQRLLAIYNFFDGPLTLAKDFEYIEEPSLRLGGLAYQDLVQNYPKIARKFDNASLTVMSVITDDESKINDMFVRLNTSKPLSGSELRNAMQGEVPQLIRSIADHDFFTRRVAFSMNRSEDRNTAAKLLLVEHRGALMDTKKSHLDALVEEAEQELKQVEETLDETVSDSENPNVRRSAERVTKVLEKMSGIFVEKDPLLAQQAQIVPIYWLIREVDPETLGKMRMFLVQFDQERRANKAARETDGPRNPELDDFELMARTSNDASSIRNRYQILRRHFEDFIR
jgi:hypothetical protein